MSVTLNEPALRFLLNSTEGAVAQDLQVRAQRIVELAQQNARTIMHANPQVVDAIDWAQSADLTTFVGIRDQGSMSRYLDAKEGREHAWMLPAFLEGFDP